MTRWTFLLLLVGCSGSGDAAAPAEPATPVATVTELPPPQCHDVPQRAREIHGGAERFGAPDTVAPGRIPDGTYVLAHIATHVAVDIHGHPAVRETVVVRGDTMFVTLGLGDGADARFTRSLTYTGGLVRAETRCSDGAGGAPEISAVDVSPAGFRLLWGTMFPGTTADDEDAAVPYWTENAYTRL